VELAGEEICLGRWTTKGTTLVTTGRMGVLTMTGTLDVTDAAVRVAVSVGKLTCDMTAPSSSATAAGVAQSVGQNMTAPFCHHGRTDTGLASAVTESLLPSSSWTSSVVMIGFICMTSIQVMALLRSGSPPKAAQPPRFFDPAKPDGLGTRPRVDSCHPHD